jgi:hypothetical protein
MGEIENLLSARVHTHKNKCTPEFTEKLHAQAKNYIAVFETTHPGLKLRTRIWYIPPGTNTSFLA